jgi:hypothetical protein
MSVSYTTVWTLSNVRTTDTLRQLLGTRKRQVAALAVWATFLYIAVRPDGEGLYRYGTTMAAGDGAAAAEALRGTFLMGALFLYMMYTFRSVVRTGKLQVEDRGMVTAMPLREFVFGVLLAEVKMAVVSVGSVAVVGSLAFGYGAGALVPGASLAAWSLLVVAAAPVVTYPVGLAGNWLFTKGGLQGNSRVGAGLLFVVAYYTALFNSETLAAVLGASPVGTVVEEMVLVGAGASGSPLTVVAGVAGLATVAGGAAALSVPLARYVWFSEMEFESEHADPQDITVEHGMLARVVPTRVAALAGTVWRRGRRNPYTLAYVVPPVVAVALVYVELVASGRAPAAFPGLVGVFGAMAMGSAFTLNAFGAEGDALPWVLTSPIEARDYVLGHAVASWLLGVPVTLAAVAVAAVGTTPFGPVGVVVSLAFALAMTLAAPLVSLALGLVYPAFSSVEPIDGMPTALPSRLTVAGFSVTLTTLGLPGVVGLMLAPSAGPLPTVTGVAVSVAATALAAAASYRYAVRYFTSFTYPLE